MADPIPTPAATCPDCNGETVRFGGAGLSMQYCVCPKWKEPGHLSGEDIGKEIACERSMIGRTRFA
jgi:hypothetical protein